MQDLIATKKCHNRSRSFFTMQITNAFLHSMPESAILVVYATVPVQQGLRRLRIISHIVFSHGKDSK